MLPVIAIILALELFLLRLANLLRKLISLLTLIILFLNFLLILEEIIKLAPFLIACEINLFPSFFFPFMAKNKLFLFKSRESKDNPLNL